MSIVWWFFFLGAKNVWLTKLKIRKERGVSGKKKGGEEKKKIVRNSE